MIKVFHLRVGNVVGIASPLGNGPEFRPQGQGKKLWIKRNPLELAGGRTGEKGGLFEFKGSHPLLIGLTMADNRDAVFQHISIHSGLIEDRDTLLVKEVVLEAEASYQARAFNTYLGHCPEVDIL